MIKKILSVIFAAVLVFAMGITVFSATGDVQFDTMLIDYPDILSDSEETELEARAWEMTKKYHCAVYIMITDTLDGMEAWEYNELVHSELSLGYGTEKSSITLLLSTGERQYDIAAFGYGNTVFTDYGKDKMADRFVKYFAEDDWYGGFSSYLDSCEEYFELALYEEPYDVSSDKGGAGFIGVLIAILISCLIALVICLVLRAQMKTARRATEAHKYAKKLNLTNQYDLFSHRDIHRVYNPPQDSNNGGTTINGSGFSHKSGGF